MEKFSFERGLEYNKLAISFNSVYKLLQQFESNIDFNPDPEYDIQAIAYIIQRDIRNRLDKYSWDWNSPIVIPMISSEETTLETAYEKTANNLVKLSTKLGYSNDVRKIFEKEDLYFELDKLLGRAIR